MALEQDNTLPCQIALGNIMEATMAAHLLFIYMSLNLSLVLMPLTRTLSYGGGADRCGISNFISTARDTLLHVVRSPPGEQEIYSRK